MRRTIWRGWGAVNYAVFGRPRRSFLEVHCQCNTPLLTRCARHLPPKRGRAAVALLRRSWLAWQTRGASGLRRAVNPNAPRAQPQSSAPKGGDGGEEIG